MPSRTRAEKPLETPRVLVANGVNLDLLGKREPDVYGRATLADLERHLSDVAPGLARASGFLGVELAFFQSNEEAAFLGEISKTWDGALINPGAWTHTSLALGDRLAALSLPFVEIHLSNLAKREPFRKTSYSAVHAAGVVYGMGIHSYAAALVGLLATLKAKV